MTEGELNAPSGVSAEAEKAGIMYEMDLATGVIKWNDKLYDVMKYARTEPLDTVEWWVSHIHPQDAMILNQALDRLEDPTQPGWTVEYRFKNGEGNYVFVKDKASIIRDPKNAPISLIGTLSLNDREARGIMQDDGETPDPQPAKPVSE